MSACGYENGLISIDEAINTILDTVQALPTEILSLKNSLSKFIAEPVYSPINLPSFDQSAVDGYALCTDQTNAHKYSFELVGEIRAGQESDIFLTEGQAVRIFTGGKLPQGTTTIARQEIVQIIESSKIKITSTLKVNEDIRRCGEEVKKGQCIAEVGQYINIGSLAALSMAGVQSVNVYRQPKVAVIVTGDEITQNQNSLSKAQVFDANSPLLDAWFKQNNIHADIFHVADQRQLVTQQFEHLKKYYDLIVTTGGVSVGDYDFVRPCSFEAGFEQIFWKVKQKPGKPLYFAKYQQQDHRCYLLGLPGNPAAVYVCIQVYGKLILQALQNQSQPFSTAQAKLKHDIKPDARERFLRMVATFEGNELEVSSLPKQQSHMLSNLMQCNSLVRIPAGDTVKAGTLVECIFL